MILARRIAAILTEIIEVWTKRREKRRICTKGHTLRRGARHHRNACRSHPRERGTVFDIEHPTRGTYLMIGSPPRLSDSPVATSPAPLLGEHTEAVLTSVAGYTADEVRELHAKGII